MKRLASALAILVVFILGALAYTWPGPLGIWEQRTDQFMSDGTDLTTNPFQFDELHQAYQRDPKLFFYGAYPSPRLNAPEGFVAWYAWNEKIAGAFFPSWIPVEQVSVLLALVLMVLNGLCFYGMARAFGWEKLLSLSLSLAWAFSAYTRARAQVHASLVGTYAIPLALLGFLELRKHPNQKGIALASLCFVGCVTSAHYYLIFLFLFSPFFLAFYFGLPEVRKNWKNRLLNLFLASLPAMVILTFSFLKPVPSEFAQHVSSILPQTGESETWPHPFLEAFGAKPLDYFTGDIAIGTTDWNPLRRSLTLSVRQDPQTINFHEHALGIRWIVWLAFLFGLGYMWRNRNLFSIRSTLGAMVTVVLSWGLFAFLSSLAPDWGLLWGPSAWIYSLVHQVRVPNRIGIYTHFSLLVFWGLWCHSWLQSRTKSTRRIVLWLLPLLMIVDLPPVLNAMPMAATVPSKAPLISRKEGHCGLGLHFPHFSGSLNGLPYYYLLQSLRGTDCSLLNPATGNDRDLQMTLKFGYQNKNVIHQIESNDEGLKKQLVAFAQCTQLDWIVFDSRLPTFFVQDVCQRWGGKWMGDNFCRSTGPAASVSYGKPDQCLSQFH